MEPKASDRYRSPLPKNRFLQNFHEDPLKFVVVADLKTCPTRGASMYLQSGAREVPIQFQLDPITVAAS